MAPRLKEQNRETKRRQRGAALLIMLTLIVLAASYTLLKRVNAQKPEIVRAADTTRALGQAKAALMGYALRSPVRPGELPCPDYDLDGQSDLCQENGTYVTLGRLPWVTLGTADLRDASGEQLWYAPALEFDGNQGINSDSTPGLRIDGAAQPISAVIIAPGAATSNQVRPQNPAAQFDPARYFEDANRVADVNFVTAPGNANIEFNDQLLGITRDELMHPVERKVLRELAAALRAFSNDYGYYPISASTGAAACDNPGFSEGLLRMSPDATCADLPDYPDAVDDMANNWSSVIWYVRDPGGALSVDGGGSSGDEVILIGGGPALAGQVRPPFDAGSLLEGLNADGDTVFETLPIGNSNNDQILVVVP